MFKKLAVAFDESHESQRAFLSALDLATSTNAEIYLVTVVENLPGYMSYVSAVAPDVPRLIKDERRSFYTDLQASAATTAKSKGVILHSRIAEGSEVDALLEILPEIQPDLLIVGLKQEEGVLGRVIGGTAHRLALHVRCSILGVR